MDRETDEHHMNRWTSYEQMNIIWTKEHHMNQGTSYEQINIWQKNSWTDEQMDIRWGGEHHMNRWRDEHPMKQTLDEQGMNWLTSDEQTNIGLSPLTSSCVGLTLLVGLGWVMDDLHQTKMLTGWHRAYFNEPPPSLPNSASGKTNGSLPPWGKSDKFMS